MFERALHLRKKNELRVRAFVCACALVCVRASTCTVACAFEVHTEFVRTFAWLHAYNNPHRPCVSTKAAIVHAYACVHSVKRVRPCVCARALLRTRNGTFVIKCESAFKRNNVFNAGTRSVRKHSGGIYYILDRLFESLDSDFEVVLFCLGGN